MTILNKLYNAAYTHTLNIIIIIIIIIRGVYPPNNHDATLPPRLLSTPLLFRPLPFPPISRGSGDMTPGTIFGITDARRRVLEHFGHKNQYLYEPAKINTFMSQVF